MPAARSVAIADILRLMRPRGSWFPVWLIAAMVALLALLAGPALS